MQPIIRVEDLSKSYRIGGRPKHRSLRDTLAAAVETPFRRLRDRQSETKIIWPLKHVSFEIVPGEIVGIIGRNGAGKSTLLKILSRITKPTHGRVTLKGRVGSLLEVGTGFHSELTGRENVFLNGAILGMSKREIAAKFDEIVAFAETEEFLDTPVKHYSSGMTVRLAFAVAAHLEPEILIIDEVLAVGDVAFQKKCLGKINEAGKHGRTVLFVSHDLNAVNGLCERALLLNEGSIVKSGPTEEVTSYYLDHNNRLYSAITWGASTQAGNDEVTLNDVSLQQNGITRTSVDCRQPFTILIDHEINAPLKGSRFFFLVRDGRGELIFSTSDYDVLTPTAQERRLGRYVSAITVPGGLLKTGPYDGTLGIEIPNVRLVLAADDCLHFDVFEPEDDTQAERHKRLGAVAPLLPWDIKPFAESR